MLFRATFRATRTTGKPGRPEGGQGALGTGQDENAARQTLSICWFDDAACSEGLKALRSYRKDWDDVRGVWRDTPRHDASSHGADAFQVLSVWWREMRYVEPEEDFETKMRREHAEHAKAMEKALKPKTLDEMLEEYDLEMAED